MWKRQSKSGNCVNCGIFRERLHSDHIVPKWKGGGNNADNLQLICANCHEDKTYLESQDPQYKQMLSKKLKGRKITNETRIKLKKLARKRVKNPIYLEKQRLAHLGHIVSQATRQKMSKSHKKRYREHPEFKIAYSVASQIPS